MLTSDAIRLVALNFDCLETQPHQHSPIPRPAPCDLVSRKASSTRTGIDHLRSTFPTTEIREWLLSLSDAGANMLPYGPACKSRAARRPSAWEGNALGFLAFRRLTLSSGRYNSSGNRRPYSARCSAAQWGPPCSGPRNGPYPAAPRRQKDILGPGVDLFSPTRRRR